jgi:hypothetical protein
MADTIGLMEMALRISQANASGLANVSTTGGCFLSQGEAYLL